MNVQFKKIISFVSLTYMITLLFFIILQAIGGRTNPISENLIGLPMAFPLLSAIILQKLIFKQSIKDTLGISFKLNIWFLLAILIPVILALLINLTSMILLDTKMFTRGTFFLNILMGLSAAAISALLEELAWRGFLFNELKSLGIFKVSLIIGVIWALWHIPVTIWYKYPNNPVEGAIINFIQMFVISIIITYIRDKSKSIFAPALMHGMFNTMILSSNMDDFKVVAIKVLLVIVVMAVLLAYGFYKKSARLMNRYR